MLDSWRDFVPVFEFKGYIDCEQVLQMYMLIGSWCLLLSGGFLALILSPRPRLSALVGSCSAVAGSMIGLMAAIPVLFSGAPPHLFSSAPRDSPPPAPRLHTHTPVVQRSRQPAGVTGGPSVKTETLPPLV